MKKVIIIIILSIFTLSCLGSDDTSSDTTITGTVQVIGFDASTKDLVVNHPVSVSISVQSKIGLANLEVSVGLVETPEENATEDEMADLQSCLLGVVRFEDLKANVAKTMHESFRVSSDCELSDTSKTLNFFTIIDIFDKSDFSADPLSDDGIAAFYTKNQSRPNNKVCLTSDGDVGCIVNVTVDENPGIDLSMSKFSLQSSTVILYDGTDSSNVPAGEGEYNPAHAKANIAIRLDGVSSDAENDLTAATEIRYDICPKNGTNPDCVLGEWMPVTIFSVKDAASGHDRIAEVSSLSGGHDSYYQHDLYFEGDTLTAISAGGAWADHGQFTLRACINIPRAAEAEFSLSAFTPLTEASEMGYGESLDNNCKYFKVNITEPRDQGNSPSLSFDHSYSNTWGDDDTIAVYADIGTTNTLDSEGAHSHTYAEVKLEGWISSTIFHADSDVDADTDISDNEIDLTVVAMDSTVYSYSREGESELTFDEDWSVSKKICATFSYGIWIVSVDVDVCASGSLGFDATLTMSSHAGDDTSNFDTTTTAYGEAIPTITPSLDFDASATASLDAVIYEAGAKASISLLDLSSPLTASLKWGSYSDSEMGVIVDVDFSTDITTLDGYLELYVDKKEVDCVHDYEPWTCSSYWHREDTDTIASWTAVTYDHSLLNETTSDTLEF
ncbi:MAG: hypothetical protein ABIA04_07460 [Pseudomonadota bacterium]